jgi:AraC-like DNA-binding protein
VRRALAARDEELLDAPVGALATPDVLEHTYPLSGDLARLVSGLRARAAGPGAREEALHDLLAALLVAQRQARAEAERVPARRASTRVELLRRLWRARDFLDATLDAAVPLARLGREAGLSPHRLLRLYQATFGETPHRYHVRRRLERAHGLLRAGLPVGEAARAVGFESPASFSTLFRGRYGCSPRHVRGAR